MKLIMHGPYVEFFAEEGSRVVRCEFADGDDPPDDWLALAVGQETGPITHLKDLGQSGKADAVKAWLAAKPNAVCGTAGVDGVNGSYQAWAALDRETGCGYVECWLDSVSDVPLGRYSVQEASSVREVLRQQLRQHDAEGSGLLGEAAAKQSAYWFRIPTSTAGARSVEKRPDPKGKRSAAAKTPKRPRGPGSR